MGSKIIDFSKYSSIKVGGCVRVKIIQDSSDIEDDLRVVGFANNLLVAPQAQKVSILDKNYDYILDLGTHIEVGAKTSSAKIYRYFKQADLSGLEFLRALPGSLGGLVKMNAGMKEYEIKNILDSVCINGQWKNTDTLALNYRSSNIKEVILAARFKKVQGFRHGLIKMFETMRATHPKSPSCGSCFKNPKDDFAGRLLESVGLKGYKIGNMCFSDKHANFLINMGKGNFDEAIKLINLGEKRVFENFGISLEKEVVILCS